jgi:formylglycine-generating enzyme required for sulfatase activity
VAWYNDNSDGKIHAVGGKSPNELGLCDMSGNIAEWCSDYWDGLRGYYANAAQTDSTDDFRVVRGGHWGNCGAACCRVSCRIYGIPYGGNYCIGFRLVVSL